MNHAREELLFFDFSVPQIMNIKKIFMTRSRGCGLQLALLASKYQFGVPSATDVPWLFDRVNNSSKSIDQLQYPKELYISCISTSTSSSSSTNAIHLI